MTTQEQGPDMLMEAKRLATVALEKPQDLRHAIAGSTLDQLDALSKFIEERKTPVTDEVSKALRERMEELMTSKSFDATLVELQKRLSLASLADIRAPKEEQGFARTFKRQFFNVLSMIEGAPSGLLGFIPGFSAVTSITSFMPSFGRRNVASMDIEDAVGAQKRLGETISFSGLSAPEFELYDKFVKDALSKGEATPAIADLVGRLLANVRERNIRAGAPRAPITVTMRDLLTNPAAKEVAELREESREEQLKTDISLSRVQEVKIGEIASFKDGVLELPSSELEGTTIKTGKRASYLLEAIAQIPSTDELTVVPEGATKAEWVDGGKKVITLSLANKVKDLSVIESLMREKPEHISVISIASNDQMGHTKISFNYEGKNGVLHVPNQEDVLAALRKSIGSLPIGEDERTGGEIYELRNGEFALVQPVSIHS